jgi:hypothetical protein
VKSAFCSGEGCGVDKVVEPPADDWGNWGHSLIFFFFVHSNWNILALDMSVSFFQISKFEKPIN